MKKITAFVSLVLLVILSGKCWYVAKDGFSLRRIAPFFPSSGKALGDKEVQHALGQPYAYLSRGRQAYVFMSEDGRYVLKLPRYDIYRAPFWMRCFHGFEKKKEAFLERKSAKFSRLFDSCALAFEKMQEETSLLYVHLQKTDGLHQKILIKDKMGRKFLLDLDNTGFFLQKKHDLLDPICMQAIKNQEIEKAKELLISYLEFNRERAEKGIGHTDSSFAGNFAIDEGKIIQIDVGKFYTMDVPNFRAAFLTMAKQGLVWLNEIDPQMALWYSYEMEKMVEEHS